MAATQKVWTPLTKTNGHAQSQKTENKHLVKFILEFGKSNHNKTGLQPVSRPVEWILGFFFQKIKKITKKESITGKTVQKVMEKVFHR